jgi:arsenate reductase
MSAAVTVLVLCTGNSARSILGEALFNRLGAPAVRAVSAGSRPKGVPHPAALALLKDRGYDTSFARSKSWDEFAGPEAPKVDLVVTVCDSAAAESCPVWPGAPLSTHWGIPDPAEVTAPPEAVEAAFDLAYRRLEARVRAALALDLEDADRHALKRSLDHIGRMTDADISNG